MNKQLYRNKAIGVLDSGVGGLTVVKCLQDIMPYEKIVYFGDTARAPYGFKSIEAITSLSVGITRFLMKQNVKAIVVGCNTISVTSLDEIKEESGLPVFGVVEAGAEAIAQMKGIKKVGIIGTARTIQSNAHINIINKLAPSVEVLTKDCPRFVPLVEDGILEGDTVRDTIKYYFDGFADNDMDALLLACTHFPLLLPSIKKFNENIVVVDPAFETAIRVKKSLSSLCMLTDEMYVKEPKFYVSKKNRSFSLVTGLLLGKSYEVALAMDM